MTDDVVLVADVHTDDHVDEEISTVLDLDNPVSFFLFADAGSGKTRSLVNALTNLRQKHSRGGNLLRLYGQRVGVITYTNAACDEIKRRSEFDPLVEVSTIHSFVWSLISGFHGDIRRWLQTKLPADIVELKELQAKGRAGTKAALDREEAIKAKQKRLASLDTIRGFKYNPVGDNRGLDSLNHTEVIQMGADFLMQKPLMQRILVTKFPILLVDESQDTNKLLMDAFMQLQRDYKGRFCLGLFGDVMQRIYADGKTDLGRDLPPDWARPTKKLNHRCPRRIIKLINRIRYSVDGHVQIARPDSKEGVVRLFILRGGSEKKEEIELRVREKMAAVTDDRYWSGPEADVKTLMLEHHMVASRMGFLEMFDALYSVDSFQTGLRDGSLSGLPLFSQLVLPLLRAKQRGDEFAVAAIVREASPLLSKEALKAAGANQRAQIEKAQEAVKGLVALWSEGRTPSFLDILSCVSRTGLFDIPESLRPFAAREERIREDAGAGRISPPDDEEQSNQVLAAWGKFLQSSFPQIEPYGEYVSGRAAFETHQGVKGLEFPRVMVVMDDSEARGFMFSYEKLFGAKDKSKTDLENEHQGKDSGVDRTRRLFYVTCSRAKESLALVAYSSNPERVRDYVVHEGWFEESEVQLGI
ncbi:MAG TPA: UvrD-helicase domain-containing protein [Candidatus Acidoferrum sp.]|nr:UvrD-helicase domain-containing protein [Candidatus Acidoferrum sp.]